MRRRRARRRACLRQTLRLLHPCARSPMPPSLLPWPFTSRGLQMGTCLLQSNLLCWRPTGKRPWPPPLARRTTFEPHCLAHRYTDLVLSAAVAEQHRSTLPLMRQVTALVHRPTSQNAHARPADSPAAPAAHRAGRHARRGRCRRGRHSPSAAAAAQRDSCSDSAAVDETHTAARPP